MHQCVRARCTGDAIASWWRLCASCTLPMLDPVDGPSSAAADQSAAAGYDAVDWAERMASGRWGNGAVEDGWLVVQRCLVFAAVVTGRARGCAHSQAGSSALPVVSVTRAPEELRCPTCAEPLVASVTTTGHACDRCRQVAVGPGDRVAILAGTSLIVVAQLCDACTSTVLQLDVTGLLDDGDGHHATGEE